MPMTCWPGFLPYPRQQVIPEFWKLKTHWPSSQYLQFQHKTDHRTPMMPWLTLSSPEDTFLLDQSTTTMHRPPSRYPHSQYRLDHWTTIMRCLCLPFLQCLYILQHGTTIRNSQIAVSRNPMKPVPIRCSGDSRCAANVQHCPSPSRVLRRRRDLTSSPT